jgi:hypothetical protein
MSTRTRRKLGWLPWLLIAYAAFTATAAAATDFTWSGATPRGAGAASWSKTTNWSGGVAPSGSVGTLTFPSLESDAACTGMPPTDTCGNSDNDVAGLSVNAISIDDGHVWAGGGYQISGNGITLGAGGITAAPFGNGTGPGGAFIGLPITLGANQTWSITSGSNGSSGLGINANVTGSPDTLAVHFGNPVPSPTVLQFGVDSEVDVELGAITVTGSGASGVNLENASVNYTDGNPVSISGGAGLSAGPGRTGPLTMSGGSIEIGGRSLMPGASELTVAGGVSLDSTSELFMSINRGAGTAGTDYPQLSATGDVDLGSAQLTLSAPGGTCPTFHVGDVLTLVTTTGSLTGTFARVPNGSTVPVNCVGTEPTVRINYTSSAVTATVLAGGGAPVNTSLPTISGTAVSGATLTERHGSWTNDPTSYELQWLRCDGAGKHCAPIQGATARRYVITPSDAGSTIEVQETARNAAGRSDPARSAPTATVPGITQPPTSSGTTVHSPAISLSAVVKRSARALARLKIRKLLRKGGFTLRFTAPVPGVMTARLTAAGRKTALARGRHVYKAAGTAKLELKLTKAGRKRLRKARRLKVSLTLSFTPAGGKAITAIGTLRLKR